MRFEDNHGGAKHMVEFFLIHTLIKQQEWAYNNASDFCKASHNALMNI